VGGEQVAIGQRRGWWLHKVTRCYPPTSSRAQVASEEPTETRPLRRDAPLGRISTRYTLVTERYIG
jgi:hypothetical protein